MNGGNYDDDIIDVRVAFAYICISLGLSPLSTAYTFQTIVFINYFKTLNYFLFILVIFFSSFSKFCRRRKAHT